MKKRKLLAGAVVAAIGGLAMTSIVNATATVTPLEGEVIEYVLNSGFDTASVFTAGVLEIDDGETKIFILDRNLGATAAGTGCEVQNWGDASCYGDGNEFDVYGYHFQRGNNYGFKPCTGSFGCATFPNGERASIGGGVSTIGYGPGNYYYGNVFFYDFEGWNGMDWSSPHNNNLWGGSEGDYISSLSGDNWKVDNPKDRQGPCPDNFHVPSYGEFLKIKSMMGNNANEIHNKLLVPFAGYRAYDNYYDLGYYAHLGSSSPCYDGSCALVLRFNFNEIYVDYHDYYDILADYRNTASSLRCLHDSYQTYTKASNLLVSFWTGEDMSVAPACSGQVTSGEVISGDLLTCVEWLSGSKQRYSLSGRRDVEADVRWTLDTPITTGLNLVAVWTPDTDANSNGIADQEDSFTITREDGDGNFVWSGEFEYGTGPVFGGTDPKKTGHTFAGWSPSVENVTGDFTYIATWAVNQYTITFNTDGGSTISPITGDFGSAITVPTNPTRDGYDFAGWDKIIPATVPAENIVITALWTAKPAPRPSSGGGGGGGGGTTLRKDNCPGGDYSDSYYDGECGMAENDTENGGEGSGDDNNKDSSATPQNDSKASTGATNKSSGTEGEGSKKDSSSQAPQNDKTGHNSAEEVQFDILKFNPKYSDEMNQAYQYAYHYGITTKDTIRNADVNGKLTRVAMAKMLSQYAINVLGMTPDKTRINQFADVSKKLDSDYDNGVTLAYQLGIMGINMPNNKFRPNSYVTRAQFVTALSRLLYKTKDGTDKYYSTHMAKLYNEGIITSTDPTMLERRGYVMIMLMRSENSRE